MSKNSWEEDIEKQLNRMEGKLDQLLGGTATKKTVKPERRRKTPVTQSFVPGNYLKAIEGTLLDDPVQRDVETRSGPASIVNFTLNTDLGEVRVGLWEDLGYEAMELTAGGTVILTNMKVNAPYNYTAQISSTKNTELELAD